MRFFITPALRDTKEVVKVVGGWFSLANNYHLFWDCTQLPSYWHDVHDCLEHIFQITVQFDVSTMC